MILNRTLNLASCAFFVGSPSQRGLPALRELFRLNATSYPPHFALHKTALVLLIPALCCQKVPGPYSSGTGVWVPSLYLFCGSAPLPSIGLNADALQSVQAKLTRAQNIRVICGMGEGRGGSHHAFCPSRPRRSIWGPGMCASVAEKPFTSEVQQFFCRELLNGCTCWEFMKSASNKV